METMRYALALIGISSSLDFQTPNVLEWGQWCRDVAWAGERGDHKQLDALALTVPEKYRPKWR